MDFTALDFETANYERASACAVGLAVVRNGKLEDVSSLLIRPDPLDFQKKMVAIHGITEEHVKDAPPFSEVWPQVESVIGDGPIVMHNAPFDVGVLCASLEFCGVALPHLRYFCTLQLSRLLLPGLPNHRLKTLARVFGIPLDHHDPASDAAACAQLGIFLTGLAETAGIDGYLSELRAYGASRPDPLVCTSPSISISLEDLRMAGCDVTNYSEFLAEAAAPDGRFEGMRFVFTGDLAFLGRTEAILIVEFQGGKVTGSVSRKSNCVVVGDDVWATHKRGGKTTGKLQKALELQKAGADIRIITEMEFLELCSYREDLGNANDPGCMLEEEEANLRHFREI